LVDGAIRASGGFGYRVPMHKSSCWAVSASLGVALIASALAVPAWAASPIPAKPLPGQRRAPCNEETEFDLNGGCWKILSPVPGTPEDRVKAACNDPASYELEPGDCLRNKRLAMPVMLPKENS
jgi:hypothetical protein